MTGTCSSILLHSLFLGKESNTLLGLFCHPKDLITHDVSGYCSSCHLVRTLGRLGVTIGNMGGTVGNIGGAVGNICETVGNMGETVGNMGWTVGNMGGTDPLCVTFHFCR